MKSRKKALAASFVITVAAGCDATKSQPPTAPTVDVGTAPSTSGASTTPAASTTPSAAPSDSVAQTLPPAPTVGRIEVAADGTCTWYAPPCPMVNGRMIPCNPPRPHPVQCPPDAGGGGYK
jgi:hypothetical protein